MELIVIIASPHNRKAATHDNEIRHLYEEMEAQIKNEKDRLLLQVQRKHNTDAFILTWKKSKFLLLFKVKPLNNRLDFCKGVLLSLPEFIKVDKNFLGPLSSRKASLDLPF